MNCAWIVWSADIHLGRLQIFRPQPRSPGQARQHARAYLFAVMESKDNVGPALALKDAVRTGTPFLAPANRHERGQKPLSLD
jgi:hypothetical protein